MGTTVWRWDQAEPFGNNPANEDPDGNAIVFDLPLRLPGQRYDAETGLHYNYFRDYDPTIGRYIESDPLGLVAGLNTYAYSRTNPIRYRDEHGLASAEVDCRKLNFPIQPDPCIDSQQCFDNVEKQNIKCNLIKSVFEKIACLKCNDVYQGSCPGKEPDPSCGPQACIPSKDSKG
jgi:RHS repeat-associated protein